MDELPITDEQKLRLKLLDYADRLERGEPWMHKGAKFTKWIKEVVTDMRADAAPGLDPNGVGSVFKS